MSLILLGILNSQVTGGGAGAYDLLETQVLSSSAASVTFTGLGSYDYKHLQIRMVTRRGDSAGTLGVMRMRLNGVTGTSYAMHSLQGDGSSVTSLADTTTDRIEFALTAGDDASTNPAGAFGASIVDILDFSSASKNTTIRALNGVANGTGATSVQLRSGLFNNTAAITSVEIYQTVNMEIGSRFSLYGIR